MLYPYTPLRGSPSALEKFSSCACVIVCSSKSHAARQSRIQSFSLLRWLTSKPCGSGVENGCAPDLTVTPKFGWWRTWGMSRSASCTVDSPVVYRLTRRPWMQGTEVFTRQHVIPCPVTRLLTCLSISHDDHARQFRSRSWNLHPSSATSTINQFS